MILNQVTDAFVIMSYSALINSYHGKYLIDPILIIDLVRIVWSHGVNQNLLGFWYWMNSHRLQQICIWIILFNSNGCFLMHVWCMLILLYLPISRIQTFNTWFVFLFITQQADMITLMNWRSFFVMTSHHYGMFFYGSWLWLGVSYTTLYPCMTLLRQSLQWKFQVQWRTCIH